MYVCCVSVFKLQLQRNPLTLSFFFKHTQGDTFSLAAARSRCIMIRRVCCRLIRTLWCQAVKTMMAQRFTHTHIHTPAQPPFRRNSLQNVCTCAASGRVRQRSASSARPDAGTTAPLTAETCARAGEESERIWAGAGRGGGG